MSPLLKSKLEECISRCKQRDPSVQVSISAGIGEYIVRVVSNINGTISQFAVGENNGECWFIPYR